MSDLDNQIKVIVNDGSDVRARISSAATEAAKNELPQTADIKAAIDKHMAPLLEQGIRPMTKREAWDNSELAGYALIGGDEWEPVDEERDTA